MNGARHNARPIAPIIVIPVSICLCFYVIEIRVKALFLSKEHAEMFYKNKILPKTMKWIKKTMFAVVNPNGFVSKSILLKVSSFNTFRDLRMRL